MLKTESGALLGPQHLRLDTGVLCMGQLFAAAYDTLLWPLERVWLGKLRRQTLGRTRGRTLEIGVGTGLNLLHYPAALDLVGVEPDAGMLARARQRAARLSRTVRWCQARAEALPFKDASFDTVVGTLVFCTIADPQQAFREVRRVLKPDGGITLLEHVHGPQPLVASLQDWLTPVWKRICGGCHLNRETLAIASTAGIHIRRVEPYVNANVLIIEAGRDR